MVCGVWFLDGCSGLCLQVRTKDVLFESISHLIDYHLKNGLPIVAAESELHLRGVVSREP